MPRHKNDPTAALAQTLTGASPAAPPAEKPKAEKPKNAEKPSKKAVYGAEPALPPGQAQVVASLVATGYSYQEAVAMLSGDGKAKADAPSTTERKPTKEELAEIKRLSEGNDEHLPPVPDVEEKFDLVVVDLAKRPEYRTLLDDYWTRREEMEDVPKKTRYRVTLDLEGPEFDWLLHRTITEGQNRKDAEWSVQRTVNLLLKQQKMLDPTKGGRRQMGSSGPKENFSPATGGWTKPGT